MARRQAPKPRGTKSFDGPSQTTGPGNWASAARSIKRRRSRDLVQRARYLYPGAGTADEIRTTTATTLPPPALRPFAHARASFNKCRKHTGDRAVRRPVASGQPSGMIRAVWLGARSGYPHSSTFISISKKKYSIPVIEILYPISISPTPVLSLSHILYLLFYILFPSPPFSLPNTLSPATVFGVRTQCTSKRSARTGRPLRAHA
jgi:hypothetical protein